MPILREGHASAAVDGEPRRLRDGRERGSDVSAHDAARSAVRGLGRLSLGVGVAALAAPGPVATLVGLRRSPLSRAAMRAVGLHELAAGLGLMSRPRPTWWLWARTAGDLVRLAALAAAAARRRRGHRRAAMAALAVAGVGVVDLITACALSRRVGAAPPPVEHAVALRKAITINRAPEDVYAFWRDFTNAPRFVRGIETVSIAGDRRSHWRARGTAGMTVEWDSDVVEDSPGEYIAWQSTGRLRSTGSVRFQRAPRGQGTEVQVRMDYTPPAGVIGASVAQLVGAAPEQALEDGLRRLKQILETGEQLITVTSQAMGRGRGAPPGGPPAAAGGRG